MYMEGDQEETKWRQLVYTDYLNQPAGEWHGGPLTDEELRQARLEVQGQGQGPSMGEAPAPLAGSGSRKHQH